MDSNNILYFDEKTWLRMLLLLGDMQSWINDMEKDLFFKLPIAEKKKLFRKSYSLSAAALSHIIEKHYYKIPRHPEAGKFTIPVYEIVAWIREAGNHTPNLSAGSLNQYRVFDAGTVIGHDQYGESTQVLTVVTNAAGQVITAFPGLPGHAGQVAEEEPVWYRLPPNFLLHEEPFLS